jgi:polysaccharide pyruvyl transferase CsaB
VSTKVFLSGYYGFANAGDEAILTVLLRHLRARIPGVEVTVVSGRPEETARAHNVETVLWSDPLAIADAIRRADLVLTGGGGLFHDYTGFIPDALLTHGNWGLGYHVTPAFLAALYEKPFMLYSVGVGPLFSQHGKRYTKAACEAAARVTVRDAESRDILLSIGVAPEKVIVTADPALALEPTRPPAPLPDAAPRVGVVVRHWAFGVHPVYWEGEVAAALDLFLERHGGSVVFIPFQDFPGEAENDVNVATRVRSRMKRQDQATLYPTPCAPAELAAVVASCDLIVGMRLHAVIFSILGAVPFVALRYDPKVSHAVALAGLERFEIDMGALDAPLLAGRMEEALAAREEIEPKLRTVHPALAIEAERTADLAVETLSARPAALPGDILALLRVSTHAQLRESSALSGRLQQTESVLRDVDQRRQALETERQGLQSQTDALRIAAGHLQDELRAMKERAAALDATQCETQRQLESARAQVEEYRRASEDRDRLDARLAAAESLRVRTVNGIEAFQAEWNQQFGLYRSQRAWRVMLFCRKAYARLARRGVFSFLGWLPGALVGSGGLESEELTFPSVAAYVPKELRRPIRSDPGPKVP